MFAPAFIHIRNGPAGTVVGFSLCGRRRRKAARSAGTICIGHMDYAHGGQ